MADRMIGDDVTLTSERARLVALVQAAVAVVDAVAGKDGCAACGGTSAGHVTGCPIGELAVALEDVIDG